MAAEEAADGAGEPWHPAGQVGGGADQQGLEVLGRRLLGDVGDDAGDVVGAAGLEAGADQLDGREVGRAGAEDVVHPLVGERAAGAVAADEDAVADLGRELEEVGLLVADAVEGLEDEVAVRVGPRLLLGDAALVDEGLHEGVVVGELAQLAAAVEVGAAVADVADAEAVAVEEDDRGGRGRAVEGGVLLDDLGDPVVGAVHGAGDLAEDVLVGLLVELAQRLHGRARGEVAADGTADAVADREQPRTGVPAVLVLPADASDVGDRGVVEEHHFRSSRMVLPTRTWTPRPMVVGWVMRTGPT